jgi:predicted transcriptional regulator
MSISSNTASMMSTISIQIPHSLKQQVERLAESDGITIDQFFSSAVAEKIAALEAGDYLANRAKRADRNAFLNVLAKVQVGGDLADWDQLP